MASTHDELRSLLLDCMNLARKDISAEARAAIEESREEIKDVLAVLANIVARRDPTKHWFTRSDAPGYLLRQVGSVEVRVPLHLVDDVPSDDVVNELLGLATVIHSDGAVICLSGSCAIYGALQMVADCDFCEYLHGNSAEVVYAAAQAAAKTASGDVVPLKVTGWGKEDWTACLPWPNPLVTDDRAAATRTMMAHYLGRTNFAGDLEVTKVMIPIAESSDDGRDSSFPSQELPLAVDGWVPRALFEPREIAAYVVFLRGQVKKYESPNVLKALKRAFSLARVLFLAEEADALAALFQKTKLLLRAAANARADYAQRLRTEYGTDVPPEVCQRALASAVALFRRYAGVEAPTPATAEEMLAAMAALPNEGATEAGKLLERFVRSVDAMLPAGVH